MKFYAAFRRSGNSSYLCTLLPWKSVIDEFLTLGERKNSRRLLRVESNCETLEICASQSVHGQISR